MWRQRKIVYYMYLVGGRVSSGDQTYKATNSIDRVTQLLLKYKYIVVLQSMSTWLQK